MSKTLTISDEAYERLASRKEVGESFSNVINKLTGKASVLDLADVLTGKEADALEKNIKDRRRLLRQRIEKISKSL